MQSSFISLFYLLGAAQGAFLAFCLYFTSSGSRKANRYLCLFTLMLTLGLLDYFLAEQQYSTLLLNIRILSWGREFLFGVFIYFYARELTHPEQYSLSGIQWLHFVPAGLHLGLLLPLLLAAPETLRALLTGENLSTSTQRLWSFLLTDGRFIVETCHLPIYLLLSIRLLLRHEQNIKANFSYQEAISLKWLRNLIIGTFIVYLVWVLEDLLNIGVGTRVALGVAIVSLIYTMGYLGLRQPLIFVDQRLLERLSPTPEAPPEKLPPTTSESTREEEKEEVETPPTRYENSSLSESSSKALFEEIDQIMQTQKLYLEPQLSLPQLADALGLSVPYVSQAVNQQTGQNFFDFVNQYRVQHIIHELSETSEPSGTLLDIGLAAGFNSKSAYYTAFKKVTQQTPGQYRSSALKALKQG